MSNVQKNYYERDKLQHENEARKVNLCTYEHQAFKNIIAHQIISSVKILLWIRKLFSRL
jgi:hypothetical protein